MGTKQPLWLRDLPSLRDADGELREEAKIVALLAVTACVLVAVAAMRWAAIGPRTAIEGAFLLVIPVAVAVRVRRRRR